MAKGIPLMGRGPDGKAKMINVDENGNVKVQQSGTKTLETLANAVSVAPRQDQAFTNVDPKGAKETWFLISTDKQPWSLRTSAGPWTHPTNPSPDSSFPEADRVTETFNTINPYLSLKIMRVTQGNFKDEVHSSLATAKALAWQGSAFNAYFVNHSNDTATVTIKIMRVY